ncbi:MAG: AMP-binding protein [Betaproteobacteria bacterium]|nr:AMP-binding protein [Betaproteobacteria bacterium]
MPAGTCRRTPDGAGVQRAVAHADDLGSSRARDPDARGRLASWGIERGDVLAAAVPDRVECAATLAILPASSTLALFDPTLSVDDFIALIRRVGAKAAVVPAGGNRALREAARRLGVAEVEMAPDGSAEAGSFGLALRRPAASLDGARRLDARWAYIGATSGTTGQPKLVPHGHRQLLVTARAMGARLSMTHDDVSGHLTPLHLANGLRTALMLAVLNGGSVRCLPEADAGALLDAIDEDAITYVSASFTILREVIERVRAGRRPRRGRLRFIRAASAGSGPTSSPAGAAARRPRRHGAQGDRDRMVLHQRLPARAAQAWIGRRRRSNARSGSSATTGVSSLRGKLASSRCGARRSSTATSTIPN